MRDDWRLTDVVPVEQVQRVSYDHFLDDLRAHKEAVMEEHISYGHKAVGASFNPSGDATVGNIKEIYASLIDNLNDIRGRATTSEKQRLLSIAITEAQGAQMWAVKAVTWADED